MGTYCVGTLGSVIRRLLLYVIRDFVEFVDGIMDVVARDARAEEVDKFADVGGNEAEVENNSVDPGRLVSSGRDTFETGV
jgi:hypothetical protein